MLGGFRLSDGRTHDEAIASARSRIDALPYDPAKTPSENVLAILRTAARKPGDLTPCSCRSVERLPPWPAAASSSEPSPRRPASRSGPRGWPIACAGQRGHRGSACRWRTSWGGCAAQRLAAGLPAEDPLPERTPPWTLRSPAWAGVPTRSPLRGRGGEPPRYGRAVSLARDDPSWPGGWPPCRLRLRARPRPGWTGIVLITGASTVSTARPVPSCAAGPAPGSPAEHRRGDTDRTDRRNRRGHRRAAQLCYSVFATAASRSPQPARRRDVHLEVTACPWWPPTRRSPPRAGAFGDRVMCPAWMSLRGDGTTGRPSGVS